MTDEKDYSISEPADGERNIRNARISARNRNLLIIIGTAVLAGVIPLFMWPRHESADKNRKDASTESKQADAHEEDAGSEVELSPAAFAAAGIEIVEVSERTAVSLLRVTGAVEANQQQTQQVTPLVSGRVERVNVVPGDHVRAGAALAVVSSPEVAEMHGKLHEAETRLALTEQNYARVQRAENRVTVIQAKARLDEAEATLRRTKRLIELGAGAGKDLLAAEAAHKTAKADYDYQSNISINREVQQARSEVEIARVEVSHLRNSLRTLGAELSESIHIKAPHDTSLVALRAPVSGTVTERFINAGAGIEAGKPILTVSNISTVWVIANVPEGQVNALRVGTPAEIRSAAMGPNVIAGRVTYIDTTLNEETRTGRVRVEIANPGERLKVGMFVEVGFQTGTTGAGSAAGKELVIPDEAVQRIGDRSVVFVPKENESGHFEVRDVQLGGTVDGYRMVLSGIAVGERLVTKGSFALKTQLMKSSLGEEH
ncbi:MAG: efflux RND transporter periplasmic adaptor subunit [Acidobacteriota bacterium]